jgi:hypothetical protein
VVDKKQTRDIRIRHVSAILEVGEILNGVLTPEERRALQGDEPDINRIKAKRRYRWNGEAK